MEKTIKLIPAIDLKDGNCVQLVGGDFNKQKITLPDYKAVAKDFLNKGIKRLHIVDLNAAKGIGSNITQIKDIVKIAKEFNAIVEVGGGIRSIEKAKELIDIGVDFLIVGTAAIKNPSLLDELVNEIGKEKIIIGLDYKNKKVAINGWDEEVNKSPIELGKELQNKCSQFLMTCVDKEGLLGGPDLEYLKEIKKELKIPIIASGGIGSKKDLIELDKIGIDYCVVGMAIYTGKIEVKDWI